MHAIDVDDNGNGETLVHVRTSELVPAPLSDPPAWHARELEPGPCYCPGDCACRHQGAPYYRTSYCGCRRHADV